MQEQGSVWLEHDGGAARQWRSDLWPDHVAILSQWEKIERFYVLDLKAFCFLKFTVATIWGMDWLGETQEEQN